MFAPKLAKPQTMAAKNPTNGLTHPRSAIMAQRHGPVEQALILQRAIGNQATLRLLAQRPRSLTVNEYSHQHEQDAEGSARKPQGPSWDFSKVPIFPPDREDRPKGPSAVSEMPVSFPGRASIPQPSTQLAGTAHPGASQAKLVVGATDSPLEREADQLADQVMRMPEPTTAEAIPRSTNTDASAPVSVSRLCSACAKGEESALRRKRTDPNDENLLGKLHGSPPPVTEGLEQQIDELDVGAPLPPQERSFFEPRFGHDFSAVRVHTDAPAAALALRLQARAFTLGPQIIFGDGEFSSGTEGRHLLAHELTHVVQQGSAPPGTVRRDLATPPPEPAPAAQAGLTKAQIDAAIRFNEFTYDQARTRQLQDLIGTEQTGVWTEQDILAVASLQQEYGLTKDGKIGPRTFQFLDRETRAEKLDKTDENCLLAFRVGVDTPTAGPLAAGAFPLHGGFGMSAQFSQYCSCADYQYRQFIRGHLRQLRGGAVIHDFAAQFPIPAGPLQDGTFIEDGNNADAVAPNYGHRGQGNEGTLNGYFDNAAGTGNNQAAGCFFLGHDAPGTAPGSPGIPATAGDVFDAFIDFRGEIRRGGKVVETQFWAALNGRFTA